MTAKLDKTIKRELELDRQLYTIAIAPEGIKVTEKGRRNGPEMSWRSFISGDASLNRGFENLRRRHGSRSQTDSRHVERVVLLSVRSTRRCRRLPGRRRVFAHRRAGE